MGFSVPLAEWLAGSLKGWASDLLSPATLRRQGVLDASLVERTWTRFQAGDTSLDPEGLVAAHAAGVAGGA